MYRFEELKTNIMKQQLSISVKQPCTEDFNQFKPTACGGFCNSCQKDVIDFRSMSDAKLITYFKNQKETTCGIFKDTQLKSYAVEEEQSKRLNFHFLRAASIAVISLLSLQGIQAQKTNKAVQTVQGINKTGEVKVEKSSNVNADLLTGTVSDTSSPLPGVNIVLKGSTIGAITNFDGEFEFPKPLKEGDVLVVSYIGFETQNIVIKKNQKPLKIVMRDDVCILVGKVAVNEVYSSKKNVWQKIKGIF